MQRSSSKARLGRWVGPHGLALLLLVLHTIGMVMSRNVAMLSVTTMAEAAAPDANLGHQTHVPTANMLCNRTIAVAITLVVLSI